MLGIIWGVQIARLVVYGGLCWGSLIQGNYDIGSRVCRGFRLW